MDVFGQFFIYYLPEATVAANTIVASNVGVCSQLARLDWASGV